LKTPDHFDPHGLMWRGLKAAIEAEIETQRGMLESPQLDATDTEFVRGRIRALRDILALSPAPQRDAIPSSPLGMD
jgi:hypothetical protein